MDHENEQERPVVPRPPEDQQAAKDTVENSETEALAGRELTEEEMAQAAVNLDRCQRCAHLDEKPTEEGLLRCAAHKMLMKPERNEMPDDCMLFAPKKG